MRIDVYGEGYPPRFVKKVNEILKEAGISIPEWVWIYDLPENEWNIINPIHRHMIIDIDDLGEKPKDVVLRRKLFAIKLISNKKEARVIKKKSKKDKSYIILEMDGKRYELEFRKIPYNYRKIDAYPFNNRIYLVFEGQIYKSHNEVNIAFRDPSKEEAEIISAQLMLDIKEVKGLKGDIRAAIDGMINRAKEINKITGRPLNKVIIGKKYKEFIISRRFTGPPTNSYEICISYSPFDKEEFEEVEVGPFVVPIGRYLKKKELYDIVDKGNQPYYAITRKTIGDYTVLTSGDKIIGICKKLPRGRVDVYEYKGKVVAGVFYYVEEVITDHNKFPKKIKDYLIEKLWR